MSQLEKVAALLVSEDPKQKADRILSHAIGEAHARGGAVLSISEGRIVPYVVHGIDLDVLARLRRLWPTIEKTLRGGWPSVDKGLALAPIREGSDLLGILLLNSPESFDADDLGVLLMLLAKALTAGRRPAQEAGIQLRTSAAEAERVQLLSLLHEHDWNIARVAVLLGIARRTVYMRLERYGIARKKVPKVLRRTVPA
jgi:hypothetical protein